MPNVSSHAEDSCLKNRPSPGQLEAGCVPSQSREVLESEEVIAVPAGPHSNPTPEPAGDPHSLEEDTYPEGGLKAWLVVFGSFCTMGAVFGLTNSAGVFESYFKQNQLSEYSHSQIGWIFSLYLFLVFFVGIQVGPVFDRYGPRALIAAGSLVTITSLMLLSLCKVYYQIILTYAVMGGLGGALLNAPAYGAIAHFFNKRRGLATGVATTAGGLGGIVFPILLQFLLGENGVGFPWACRILGFIFVGLCIPSNLFIRSRLPPKRGPDGKPKTESVLPDLTIFRDKGLAMATVGVFFMEWGLFVPLTYIVSYARAQGNSQSSSSILLSLLNAGSVVGRFLPGLLADKFGRFNVIIITNGLCALFAFSLWIPAHLSNAVLVVFCVLFGFASGSNLGLYPVCIGQFCESQSYGRYFSTASMIASFGTLTSVPIGGALVGLGGSRGWTALVIFCGMSYVAAMFCYIAARVCAIGWKVRKIF
ncbi:hypothetical protein jhhlp_007484 [Lomentospora prolificans]|uniref:Major facilitator superfamily (MFS) profile domain-containing protein n=1 Tax=Lomentospora prolificans TaxID=41688 RepID=A0A2N3N169_9PEZI|nr:hypothetical protein jhhlp_007484 [Lomentospora prolificans]